jgi:predicted Fe-Mo cluster-binding NifX family protein
MEYETIENSNAHHAHGMCNPLAALGPYSVDGILLNSIGRRALEKLGELGIKVYRSGAITVEEAVKDHLQGRLEVMTPDNACARHGLHNHGRVQGFVDLQGS